MEVGSALFLLALVHTRQIDRRLIGGLSKGSLLVRLSRAWVSNTVSPPYQSCLIELCCLARVIRHTDARLGYWQGRFTCLRARRLGPASRGPDGSPSAGRRRNCAL